MLHRLAYADQLTGLANRRQMFLSVVSLRSMARTRGAVLLLALDGFSAVSDARGYDIGDAVLVEVAKRLRRGAGETDLLARLAGDEFAVVTEGGPVQAYALASRLLAALSEPISLAGVTVFLTTSIGLTDVISGVDGADVLRRAGLALRRAQQLGGGRIEWYDLTSEQDMLRRQSLEQELPGAMSRGELDVVYQPMLDLVAGRPVAVEALLRWRHPRLGTLLPCDIVPLAEQLGLIAEIGGWVLRRSARQLASWLSEGRHLSIAVNISPRQMEGPGLAAEVASVLAVNNLPADRLVLELSEGQLGHDTGNVDEQLIGLRALGVRTALDGFGTGPDSLAHLRRLPMDMVKIDRSFLDEITGPRSEDDVPIMDVLVGLGRRLGIDVVAQGIEVPGHLELVRAAGCRIGQGHFFAPPQPAEHIEAYLDGFGPRP
jgi:diguanylate cyclase (GGDEF)-like protein